MAKASTSITGHFIRTQGDVMDHLNDIVKTWTKTPITAALTVMPGHDYWVILEYGSGQAESGPRGPRSTDDVVIPLPPGIPRPKILKSHTVELKSGKTVTSKWYPIKARHKKPLHFFDRHGVERYEMVVYHPGIKGLGFIRNAIRMWQYRLLGEFIALDKELGDNLPEREELCQAINRTLKVLLAEVRATTPVSDQHDPRRDATPLADAWGIDLAH